MLRVIIDNLGLYSEKYVCYKILHFQPFRNLCFKKRVGQLYSRFQYRVVSLEYKKFTENLLLDLSSEKVVF